MCREESDLQELQLRSMVSNKQSFIASEGQRIAQQKSYEIPCVFPRLHIQSTRKSR